MGKILHEEWKAIEEFEGIYEVSNSGRVRSIDRIDSSGHHRHEHILCQRKVKGYFRVHLFSPLKGHVHCTVHRLVAKAFIPNYHNYPVVNHIDENPLNNRVDNLEWCTVQYNTTYNHLNFRRWDGRRKPVKQIKDGKVIKVWDCAMSAAKEMGVHHANIYECIKGNRSKAYGFSWEEA